MAPSAKIRQVPLVDGGEGFTRALVAATGGQIYHATVTGPVGCPVNTFWGVLGTRSPTAPRTIVLEMAAAAGLSLVPESQRDPGITTTYGVGELIKHALNAGAQRIVVGCGDSGTCDGGAGMLQALGAVLLDDSGKPLPQAGGGNSIASLARVDLGGLDDRLRTGLVTIEVAVNWTNVLCGEHGVARVFGKQKGATEEQIEHLSRAMDKLAEAAGVILDELDVGLAMGGGASGGLGTGLKLIGATLRPRYEVVAEYIDLRTLFDDCDLVITAEGGIDDQTPRGKIPAEIAMRAKQFGLPVVAIAGTIGQGASVNYEAGIDAYTCILQRPTTLEEAVAEAEKLTRECAECVMRMISIGWMLTSRGRKHWPQ